MPAVTCRRVQKTTRDTLRSSGFETASKFVQETVMFLEIAGLMVAVGRSKAKLCGKKELFCLQLEESCNFATFNWHLFSVSQNMMKIVGYERSKNE